MYESIQSKDMVHLYANVFMKSVTMNKEYISINVKQLKKFHSLNFVEKLQRESSVSTWIYSFFPLNFN